jgi:hypothetical protein
MNSSKPICISRRELAVIFAVVFVHGVAVLSVFLDAAYYVIMASNVYMVSFLVSGGVVLLTSLFLFLKVRDLKERWGIPLGFTIDRIWYNVQRYPFLLSLIQIAFLGVASRLIVSYSLSILALPMKMSDAIVLPMLIVAWIALVCLSRNTIKKGMSRIT